MARYPFPNTIPVKSRGVTLVPNTGTFPAGPSGAIQTRDRGGEHLRLSLTLENLTVLQSRALAGFLATVNGQQHRVSIRDPAYLGPRGSLAVAEIIDIDFNATLWEIETTADYGAIHDISGGVRFTQGAESGAAIVRPTTTGDGIATPVVGRSYAAVQHQWNHKEGPSTGAVPNSSLRWRSASWGNALRSAVAGSVTDPTRQVVAATCHDATEFYLRPESGVSGDSAGCTVDLGPLSAARCLLVDDAENKVTRSEEPDHADWTKTNATIGTGLLDAFGDNNANTLIEDTSNGIHAIDQTYTRSSSSDWWTASAIVRANGDNDVYLTLTDGSGNGGSVNVDLTAESIASVADTGTGQWTFATLHPLGTAFSPDWLRVRLTTFLPPTTSAAYRLGLLNPSSQSSYTGDGSSSARIWAMCLTREHQLGRYRHTTDQVHLGETQTGTEIYVKGLDSATPAQLLAGDQIEINGHLYVLQSDLDGNESGVGLARVWPRILTAPTDGAPVILHRPHGTFLIADNAADSPIESTPGIWSAHVLDLIQDIVA